MPALWPILVLAAIVVGMAAYGKRRRKKQLLAEPLDLETEVREYAESLVRQAFASRDEIIERVVEYLSDDFTPEEIEPVARRITDEELAAHADEQQTWPAETDCDRLDRAFASLDVAGIVARQNFSCCGTCGHGEMRSEMHTAKKQKRTVRGYAFYHEQDTEMGAGGAGLYLAFGSAKGNYAADREIAAEVVSTLASAGLAPEWDGTAGKRILVPLDWKRRRATS